MNDCCFSCTAMILGLPYESDSRSTGTRSKTIAAQRLSSTNLWSRTAASFFRSRQAAVPTCCSRSGLYFYRRSLSKPLEVSRMRVVLLICALVVGAAAVKVSASDDLARRPANYQPSEEYYDWRKTGQPERPWFHKYDQSLVMKIFLAERTEQGKGCKVH